MSWKKVKLNQICDIQIGRTPDRNNSIYWGKGYKWVSIRDLKTDVISSTKEEITDIAVKESNCKLIPANTLLMSFKLSIGKLAFNEVPVYTNEAIAALLIKDKSKVHNRFLYYALQVADLLKDTDRAVMGATLNKKKLAEIEVILPPLEEQKRIAEVLDKADRLRQKDRQLLQKYDQLLQSVFLDMFGDPVKNEKGWEIACLGQLGKWQSGGTPKGRSNSKYFEGSIPWLSSGELNEMYVSSSKECITEEAVKNSNAKLIEPGSLLLGMYDTAALKSTITKAPCTCNQAIAYASLDVKKADTIFVYYVIQQAKEHFKKQQRGVRQKNFNLSMIKNLQVILPPIDMQNKFSASLQVIHESYKKIKYTITMEDNLFQSLLQKAFKGELQLKEAEAVEEKSIVKPKFIISSIL